MNAITNVKTNSTANGKSMVIDTSVLYKHKQKLSRTPFKPSG